MTDIKTIEGTLDDSKGNSSTRAADFLGKAADLMRDRRGTDVPGTGNGLAVLMSQETADRLLDVLARTRGGQ